MDAAAAIVQQREPSLIDKFPAIFVKAFRDMVDGVRKIGASPDADLRDFALSTKDQRAHDHIDKIVTHWGVIRPELLKFSYHQSLDL